MTPKLAIGRSSLRASVRLTTVPRGTSPPAGGCWETITTFLVVGRTFAMACCSKRSAYCAICAMFAVCAPNGEIPCACAACFMVLLCFEGSLGAHGGGRAEHEPGRLERGLGIR